jgi:hypothetical protein
MDMGAIRCVRRLRRVREAESKAGYRGRRGQVVGTSNGGGLDHAPMLAKVKQGGGHREELRGAGLQQSITWQALCRSCMHQSQS